MVAGFAFRALSVWTADLRKQHIEKDDVGEFVIGDLQSFFAGGGGADLEAGSGQSALIGHPEELAVLDKEHFAVHSHTQPSGEFSSARRVGNLREEPCP